MSNIWNQKIRILFSTAVLIFPPFAEGAILVIRMRRSDHAQSHNELPVSAVVVLILICWIQGYECCYHW